MRVMRFASYHTVLAGYAVQKCGVDGWHTSRSSALASKPRTIVTRAKHSCASVDARIASLPDRDAMQRFAMTQDIDRWFSTASRPTDGAPVLFDYGSGPLRGQYVRGTFRMRQFPWLAVQPWRVARWCYREDISRTNSCASPPWR